jgi:hypothetical protein
MASLRRAPAGDRALVAVATFVLEPSGAPTPGLLGRVKTLSDHALEPLENRDGRDTLSTEKPCKSDRTQKQASRTEIVVPLRRGYHCLVFDGPGQGAVLFEQGIPIRADWEAVVGAVIDAVIDREDVDPDRIALTGWSLAGHLALRAASGEPRLAACVADPGLLSIGAGMVGRLRAAGVQKT